MKLFIWMHRYFLGVIFLTKDSKSPLVLSILLIFSTSALSVDLPYHAIAFESMLGDVDLQLSEREQESLLEQAIKVAPELTSNPRIAGVRSPGLSTGHKGYSGGVFLGPVEVTKQKAEYLKATVRGNNKLGWTLKPEGRHITMHIDGISSWLWIEEPVTIEQATSIINILHGLVVDTDKKPVSKETNYLTQFEFNNIHRMRALFSYGSDVGPLDRKKDPYAGKWIIFVKSQSPGSDLSEYFTNIKFAVMDDGLELISIARP